MKARSHIGEGVICGESISVGPEAVLELYSSYSVAKVISEGI